MKPKNDHYVAKTFLKHFGNEKEKVWVYNKKYLNVKEKFPKSVCRNLGWSDNPYFKNSRVIEDYLMVFENGWDGAIGKLSYDTLSWQDYFEAKSIVAGYLAYLKLFPPATVRAGLSAIESIVKAKLIVLKNRGALPPPPKGFEHSLNDLEKKIRLDIDQKYPHKFATRTLIRNAQALTDMPWVIFHNKTETPFLTSDNPACNWFIGNSQIGMTYLALSPRLAILTQPPITKSKIEEKDEIAYATPKFVAQMNNLVVKCAENHVISNIKSEKILDEVKQYQDWNFSCTTSSIQTPSGVFMMQKWAPVQKNKDISS